MWETREDFHQVVEEVWNRNQPSLSVSDLAAKLSSVSVALAQWGRMSFGSVRQELRSLRHQLATLRAVPGRVGPSEEEKRVQDRMIEVSLAEEIMMRQRSRIKWLAEGDKNTGFFQKKASAHRAKKQDNSATKKRWYNQH